MSRSAIAYVAGWGRGRGDFGRGVEEREEEATEVGGVEGGEYDSELPVYVEVDEDELEEEAADSSQQMFHCTRLSSISNVLE